jgi:hypothetical protein
MNISVNRLEVIFITLEGELEMNFEIIDIYQENSKLIELKDFHIFMHDTILYNVYIIKIEL